MRGQDHGTCGERGVRIMELMEREGGVRIMELMKREGGKDMELRETEWSGSWH